MSSKEGLSADIKNISPRHEIDPRKNLERKMTEQDVIFPDDIKTYADHLVSSLENIKDTQEQRVFIIDDLNNSRLLAKIRQEMAAVQLDEDEAEAVINRVRQALLEAIKGRVDKNIFLVVKDLIKKIPGNRKNIVQKIVDGSRGREAVYKDQEVLEGQKDSKAAAMKILLEDFQTKGYHPNLVKVLNYNFETGQAIYEKLNLQTLDKYLEGSEKTKEVFLTTLKVIKDCLAGAAYLSEKDLVLQDIKLDNLGLVIEDGKEKGILFDIEGVVMKDDFLPVRLAPINDDSYIPPEWKSDGSMVTEEAEMTFQFGVCLGKVSFAHQHESYFKKLDYGIKFELGNLIYEMKEENPKNRISLAEARDRLELIISRVILEN
ncbi:MAG TPA: hypothetical protein VLK22_02470 [Candidatus Udaeobacter sp.]|nr:hypothetical protein [Candidatus Udaeobacter sp.]